jgi:hypothetical protein
MRIVKLKKNCDSFYESYKYGYLKNTNTEKSIMFFKVEDERTIHLNNRLIFNEEACLKVFKTICIFDDYNNMGLSFGNINNKTIYIDINDVEDISFTSAMQNINSYYMKIFND